VHAERVTCASRGDALRASSAGAPDSGGTLLVGHLDTVWPVGTLGERPFRVANGRATGPGVFDMKAGIAVALAVFDELGATPSPSRVSLFLAPDEETGSGASRDALVAFARGHERVLVLEPSQAGAVKIARKGTGHVEVEFRGHPAHAGLEPGNGASALLELSRFALFLDTVSNASAETTVTPTRASAGTASNVVPEAARLTVDVRVWTSAEEERVRRELSAYAPADPRISVRVDARFDRPPMKETPASRAMFDRMRAVAVELGSELRAERVGGASDGNLTAAAGLPTLDGLGPSGGGAHARDEWVDVSDLSFRAALLTRFLRENP
jgi:glutamate carboxypeptidase